ncbi:MAG: hypothetical protein ABID63_18170 [Pseudomonadota bacterium]
MKAIEIIEAAKAIADRDNEIMALRPEGVPRGAWRSENGIESLTLTGEKTTASVDYASPYFLRVFDASGQVIENIDLRTVDEIFLK